MTLSLLLGLVLLGSPQPARLAGYVHLYQYSAGAEYAHTVTPNTFLAPGIRLILGQMAGDSTAHFDDSCWIGVGIDSTATDTSMTGLQCTADSQHIAMCDSFTRGTNGVSLNWWLGVDSTEANFTWREFVLWNDSAATALDRMVHDHGLHPTNEQWLWRCEVKIE